MALDPLSLILINLLGGAVQSGIGAFGATREAKMEAQRAENQRAQLNQAIKQLENPNVLPLVEASSRNLTRSLDANAARSGGINDGVSRARENDISAEIAAQLASTLIGIESQNNRDIAQLLTDPAFSVEDPDSFNLGLDAFLGAILGAGAGATQGAGLAFNSDSFKQRPQNNPSAATSGLGFGTQYRFDTQSVDPVGLDFQLTPFGGR